MNPTSSERHPPRAAVRSWGGRLELVALFALLLSSSMNPIATGQTRAQVDRSKHQAKTDAVGHRKRIRPSAITGGFDRTREAKAPLELLTESAKLRIRRRVLPVQVVSNDGAREIVVERGRLTVGKTAVALHDVPSGNLVWHCSSPNKGTTLRFVGILGSTGLFWCQAGGGAAMHRQPPNAFAQLHRLDIRKGIWLDPMDLGPAVPKGQPVAALRDDMLALGWMEPEKPGGNVTPGKTYRVACFRGDHKEPIWLRRFPVIERSAEGNTKAPESSGIGASEHSKGALSWMGDTLLVLVGPRQPIRALNGDTGTILRVVDRVWEFEEGFAGPSVFAYFAARFGSLDLMFARADDPSIQLYRSRFDDRFRASMVGGAVAVPIRFNRCDDTYSVFVPCVRRDRTELAETVPRSYVVELNDRLEAISVIRLPYILDGDSFALAGSGVVWSGDGPSMTRIVPGNTCNHLTSPGPYFGSMAGPSWVRSIASPRFGAWLEAPRYSDRAVFGRRIALVQTGGARIVRPTDASILFPFAAVDLVSGRVCEFVLDLPFKGRVPDPRTNCIRAPGPRFETGFPYLAWITRYSIGPEGLRFVLFDDTSGKEVELKCNLGESEVFQEDRGLDRRFISEQKVHASKDPNSLDEHGQTALHRAVLFSDIPLMWALIAQGADCNARDSKGVPVLMTAAGTGTLEAVRLLLAHGADPRVRRQGDSGSTPLSEAVESRRDSKGKVRALLRAGASIEERYKGGTTPLMMAVRVGNIATAEFLIDSGCNISAKDDTGRTAMDYAREFDATSGRSSGDPLVEVIQRRIKLRVPR